MTTPQSPFDVSGMDLPNGSKEPAERPNVANQRCQSLAYGCAILCVSLFCRPAYSDLIYYGGDSIGTNGSHFAGNGTSSAQGPSTLEWHWPANIGHPSFLYHSDGKATLVEFRAVAAMIPGFQGTVDYRQGEWAIDVFTLQGYLNMDAPIMSVYLGSEPDNWSGFNVVSSSLIIPNTNHFAVPGGNTDPNIRAYDFWFDLRTRPEFADPLPIGDYIIGFQSHSGPASFGQGRLVRSFNGIGPVSYYSSTLNQPGPVYPALSPNPDFRWGMSLLINTSPVPEPSSLWLLIGAVVGWSLWRSKSAVHRAAFRSHGAPFLFKRESTMTELIQ